LKVDVCQNPRRIIILLRVKYLGVKLFLTPNILGKLKFQQEKRYIKKVLEKTGYNKAMATQILKVPRTTLWRKLKKYKLESSPLPSKPPKTLLR